jgi:guanylate kinase
MKPTIIAIVGASGSGKTYLSKLLQNELNVFLIVSYTTRPVREGEIEGIDHYYIATAHRFSRSQMLSYTRFAEYEYFALEEQVPPQTHCAYVVDERGLKYLKETKSHKFNIVSIRVESTTDTLVERGIAPERIKRDDERTPLPPDYYDFVIKNNGTLDKFEDKIRETYKKIQQWQHQK